MFLTVTTSCSAKYINVPDGVDTPPIVTKGATVGCEWVGLKQFELKEGGFDILGPDYKVTAADITINGWLDETEDVSYYSATVNKVFFGEVPQDRIVIATEGSTRQSFPKQLVRPQKGDRMIAILEQRSSQLPINPLYTSEPETREYMNRMFVFDMTEYCDVFEHDGEKYVFDQRGTLTSPVYDLALPRELETELREIYKREFPKSADRFCVRAYKYDVFTALLEKYAPTE